MALRRPTCVLGIVCVFSIVASSCSKSTPSAAPTAGNGADSGAPATAAPGIDWSSTDPTYTATLRVVDLVNAPIAGAIGTTSGQSGTSTDTGNLDVPGVRAKGSSVITIARDGYAKLIRRVEGTEAQNGRATLRLTAIKSQRTLTQTTGGSLAADGVRVSFPPRSVFAAGTNDVLPSYKVAFSSVDAATEGAAAMPGRSLGTTPDGKLVGVTMQAAAYVELTSDAGAALAVAPGQRATLSFAVPPAITDAVGTKLPLWALDPATGTWSQESSCVVAASAPAEKAATGRDRVCIGAVSHFSWWGLTSPAFVQDPSRVGCMSLTVATTGLPADAELLLSTYQIDRCTTDASGQPQCVLAKTMTERTIHDVQGDLVCHLLPDVVSAPSVTFTVEADFVIRTGDGKITTFHGATSLGALPSLVGVYDSGPIYAFTANSDTLCKTNACSQEQALFAFSDLEAYVDVDNDGYRAHVGSGPPVPGEDCDDTNPKIHPYALDAPCDGVDSACDGGNEPSAPLTLDLAAPGFDAPTWALACRTHCTANLGAEVVGNAYDEDCDGRAIDADGDGIPDSETAGFSAPWDCDDANAAVHPGATEVPGNTVDEDCDGRIIDADNDTFKAVSDLGDSDAIGTLADCDDWNAGRHPGATTSESVFAAFYRKDETGVVVRSAEFCAFVDADGSFTSLGNAIREDNDCDGLYTDEDGDGFTKAFEYTLGGERAWDANDFDPRDVPRRSDNDPAAQFHCSSADTAIVASTAVATIGNACVATARPKDATGAVTPIPAWTPGTRRASWVESVAQCLATRTNLSPACSECHAELAACAASHCAAECSASATTGDAGAGDAGAATDAGDAGASPACASCREASCGAAMTACLGGYVVADADPASVRDESLCSGKLDQNLVGATCAATPDGVATTCIEIVETSGNHTGRGTCSYDGWSQNDPPTRFDLGGLWGPCDVSHVPCGAGASCLGNPAYAYSTAYKAYLEGKIGTKWAFDGMCFPNCAYVAKAN